MGGVVGGGGAQEGAVPTLKMRTMCIDGVPCVVSSRVCGYARDQQYNRWFFLATEESCFMFKEDSMKVRGDRRCWWVALQLTAAAARRSRRTPPSPERVLSCRWC